MANSHKIHKRVSLLFLTVIFLCTPVAHAGVIRDACRQVAKTVTRFFVAELLDQPAKDKFVKSYLDNLFQKKTTGKKRAVKASKEIDLSLFNEKAQEWAKAEIGNAIHSGKLPIDSKNSGKFKYFADSKNGNFYLIVEDTSAKDDLDRFYVFEKKSNGQRSFLSPRLSENTFYPKDESKAEDEKYAAQKFILDRLLSYELNDGRLIQFDRVHSKMTVQASHRLPWIDRQHLLRYGGFGLAAFPISMALGGVVRGPSNVSLSLEATAAVAAFGSVTAFGSMFAFDYFDYRKQRHFSLMRSARKHLSLLNKEKTQLSEVANFELPKEQDFSRSVEFQGKQLRIYKEIAESGSTKIKEGVLEGEAVLVKQVTDRKKINSVRNGVQASEKVYKAARSDEERSHLVEILGSRFNAEESYVVLEKIYGQDLGKIFLEHDKHLGAPQVIEIIKQVARALDVAERAGITHKDLHPGNILVGQDGVVRLTDFGGETSYVPEQGLQGSLISELEDPTEALKKGQIARNDVYYPSRIDEPNQNDPRRDIYALGAIAHQMIVGRLPKGGNKPVSHKVYADRIGDFVKVPGNAWKELDAIIAKMLDDDVKARYKTANDLLLDLEKLQIQFKERDFRIDKLVKKDNVSHKEDATPGMVNSEISEVSAENASPTAEQASAPKLEVLNVKKETAAKDNALTNVKPVPQVDLPDVEDLKKAREINTDTDSNVELIRNPKKREFE